MKITSPHTQPNSASTERTGEPSRPLPESDRSESSGGKRFGSAMEKKAAQKKPPASPPGMEAGIATAQPLLQQFQGTVSGSAQASTAGGISAAVPAEISALSGEILHALEVHGTGQVHIQFDASVLDGLSVTLTKEGGALQVALQTSSPEAARFLEVHAASLAQTLERPERAAYISIQTRSDADLHQRHSGGGGGGRDSQDQRDQQNTGGDVQ